MENDLEAQDELLVIDIVWDIISARPAPEISEEIVSVSPDIYTCFPSLTSKQLLCMCPY